MKSKLSIMFLLILLHCITPVSYTRAQTATSTEAKQTVGHQLSEAQLASIKAIQTKWAKLVAPLAVHLAITVKAVYENMLRKKEDDLLRNQLSADMHRTAGELLTIKGQTIREVIQVLSPEQRQFLKAEMGKPDAPADLMELIVRAFNIPEQ